MKINDGKFYREPGPLNEIYDAFQTLFIDVFNERPVYNELGDGCYYVEMPSIEQKLKNIVASNTSAVTLFVGSIGVGKSSIIRHLCASNWDRGSETETILLDLNRQKTTLSLHSLPDNFPYLEKSQQKQIACQRVEKYIASEIAAVIARWVNVENQAEDLFEFYWENNLELLMVEEISIIKPEERKEKIYWLNQQQRSNFLGFVFVCLKFMAIQKRLSKLVIVVDNCDQKDPVLIEAFVDTLAHLDKCFESIKGDYDTVPSHVSIIACRPSTQAFLEDMPHNVLGTHGSMTISMDAPCSLSSIIKCRINNLPESKYKDMKMVSLNGITWEVKKHKRFFEKICESLEASGRGVFLSSICNRNVADSLKAMGEILSNARFIEFDRVIGDVASDKKGGDAGFPKSVILRALAYGNPGGDIVYSPKGTRIPNLLSGTFSVFPKTHLKPRVIRLLLPGTGINTMWTVGNLSDVIHRFYGKPFSEIDEMFSALFNEGLIETDRGYLPSVANPQLKVIATPRAQCLWQQLGSNDFLLSLYRDDCFLTDIHHYTRVATFDLEMLARCSEMIAFCEDSIASETKEMHKIVERVGINEYSHHFDQIFVSESIFDGVNTSVLMFYSKYGAITHELSQKLNKVKTDIVSSQKWIQSQLTPNDYAV